MDQVGSGLLEAQNHDGHGQETRGEESKTVVHPRLFADGWAASRIAGPPFCFSMDSVRRVGEFWSERSDKEPKTKRANRQSVRPRWIEYLGSLVNSLAQLQF